MTNTAYIQEIERLRKEKKAVILAHYYQIPEIQDIADFTGDSLQLSQYAAKTKADIIVFCGVHFMGETAKILNPQKKVLLPDLEAGCSLADACQAEDLKKTKNENPDHIVVSYINCSAQVKALSDWICTSGNALRVIENIAEDQKILFVPDKNLGAYINRETGRQMKLWDGNCHVHELLKAEQILALKKKHPEAILIAHPECNPALLEIADFVGSTAAMLLYVQKKQKQSYIVATETGILHQMKKLAPDNTYYIAPNSDNCACNDCEYMKRNTLEKLYLCLKNEKPEILLDESLIEQAKKPIERMLNLG